MRSSGSRRVGNRLVALGSAAVLTVYAAGFVRTRAAAQKLAGAEGRRVAPAPADAGGTSSPPFIEPPAPIAVESLKPARPEKSDVARATPHQSATQSTDAPAQTTTEPVTMTAASIDVTTASAATATATTTPPAATPPAATPVTVPPVASADVRTAEPAPPPPKPASLYKDGTYSGWGTSRHGDIQASVVVEDGRIVAASISQCLTRYSCSWIAHLPPQVISRQSADVDYVSGATQSSNAFYYAIAEALSKAK